MSQQPGIDSIFCAAVEIAAERDRAAYLDEACGDDAELRRRVEKLLTAHSQAGSFMNDADASNATVDQPLTEQPGDTIGPYKLLQQIGEGGMGVVYMAEQTEPVERRVALKIIKPGMDTRQVIARFEAERQALAMMDHPNIAKVLDAGTTDTGRPYFVMELVKGMPVTQFCDEQHLTTRERLELFLPICQAVQHAHQKGVIHRDLKPSNILIARYDDRAVPKIIDFGVAKAVSQRLTEKTMFTQYGQIVGTIEYMSPEQAQFNQLDVDTRSDVYSLGVLLYELLTGETPFDKQRLRSAAFDELLRIIREEEPPRPSTRLSSSQTLPSIAANRKIEPHRLSTLVRGELDWIVMKAMEKDRVRRYETASAFAADVQHYLNDEAVVACPPSAGYRFRKFARRNRTAMGATAAALLILLAVAIGSSIAAGRFRSLAQRNTELLKTAINAEEAATTAEEQERLQRIAAEEQTRIARDALDEARLQRDRAAANFALARSAVDEFLNRVAEEELLEDPGLHELRRELLEAATGFYEEFIRDEANASELMVELAGAHYRIGRIRNDLDGEGAGTPSIEKSIELFEQLRKGGHDSLDVRLGLARAYHAIGRYQDAVALSKEILENNPQHAATRHLLGTAFSSLAFWLPDGETSSSSETSVADLEHGLAHFREAVRVREELVRDFPDNPQYLADLGNTLGNLGFMLHIQGQNYDAIPLFERSISYNARAYIYEPRDAGLGSDLWNLALTQRDVGDHDAALESFSRLVAFRRRLVFDNPRVPEHKAGLYKAWTALGNQQRRMGQTAEADRSYRAAQEVLENLPRKEPDELFDLAAVYAALATGVEQDEQQRYADLAMQSLTAAVDDGYRDLRMLNRHRRLAILRDRDDFQRLVARAKQQAESPEPEQETGDRRPLELLSELVGNDPTSAEHHTALTAALHSIAMVQMRVGQLDEAEQSLNEALELHRQEQRDGEYDRFRRLDAVKTQLTMGQLCAQRGRLSEAHEIWQECLASLASLAEVTRDDPEFQFQIGLLEITISNDYGSLGLWDLAAEHARRSVQFDRMGDREIVWECRHSILLPGRVPDDQLQTYFERLDRCVPGDESPAAQLDPGQHLVWVAGCVAPEALPPDRFLALMQRRVNAGIAQFADHFTRALAQHRAGQHAAALLTLEATNTDWTTLDRTVKLSAGYLLALAVHATGDADRAEAQLQQAEALYRRYCRNLMSTSGAELSFPYANFWWELAAAQALRREALATIANRSTDDPWQHLIQARGYRSVGEIEKADSEVAAALAAAPDDPHVWLAHVELLDQWGEFERVDWRSGDWEHIAQRAGDDPAAWMYHGRWRAEHDDYDQAAADFDRALDLLPVRPFAGDPPRRLYYRAAMQSAEVWARLTQIRSDDSDLPFEWGLYLADQGEFEEALAAVREGDVDPQQRFRRQAHLAMLLLLNGEHGEYRRLCADLEMIYHQQQWDDNAVYFMSLVGTAGPDSGIDSQTLLSWATWLWNDGDAHGNATRAAGECRFRTGDFELARERLERAYQHQQGTPHADRNCFPLAMVHHQLGRFDESREWYDTGVAYLDFQSDRRDLYVTDGNQSQLVRSFSAADPFPGELGADVTLSWTPNGREIVFASKSTLIVAIEVATGDLHILLDFTGDPGPDLQDVTVSPFMIGYIRDSDVWIAGYDLGADGLIEVDPATITNVTNTPDTSELACSFSRDGTYISFSRLFDRWEIVVLDLLTMQEMVVLNGLGGRREVAWSPDGSQLAIHDVDASNTSGQRVIDLFRITDWDDPVNRTVIRVTQTDKNSDELYPDWNPGPLEF